MADNNKSQNNVFNEELLKSSIPFRELDPGMGRAVAERTILRKKENGDFESWGDVATRVAYGNASLITTENYSQYDEFKFLQKHIANGTILLSGRHLQHGDETQKTRHQEVFVNCATSATSFMKFYLLLNGSGVGRCYDDDMMLVNWDYAPNVRCVLDSSHPDFNQSAHESARDAKHKYGENSSNVMWFTIPDSREGWAKALELWENATFEKIHDGKMLILDFSEIRPKGSPIHGMQNRPASGPVALMDAFEKAAKLKGAGLEPWKQTIYLDHYFSECVLVGGARRASRMSTKHWTDKTIFDFISIKRPIEFKGKSIEDIHIIKETTNPYGFLWTSNNSVTVDDEFWKLVSDTKDKSQLAKHAQKVFKLVCQYSYGDGTGEPGFINSHKLVQKDDGWVDLNRGDYVGSSKYQINDDTQIYMSRLAKRAKKKKYHTIVNPCVTGDTLILTDTGHHPIQDLNGKKVNIWNGYEWSEVVPFSTGINQIMCINFSDGSTLRCTPYHKFILSCGTRVKAEELVLGNKLMKFEMPVIVAGENYSTDAYSQGFYSGDGCANNRASYIYFPKFCCESRLIGDVKNTYTEKHRWIHGEMRPKNWVPVNGTLEYCLNWFAGLCDSDGTVTRDINGNGIQITSIDFKFLYDTKMMLTRLGVKAKIVSGHPERNTNIKGIEYHCQSTYRLLIGNSDVFSLISIGFKTNRLKLHNNPPQRDARQFVRVESIQYEQDFEETFCFTDPKNGTGTFNGIVTAQCSEISLNVLSGFCVLADLVPYHCDTLEEVEESCRVATRALIRVNLMDSVYSKEVKRTNRIGVGLTGIHEFAFKFFGYGFNDLIDEEKSKDFWLTLSKLNRIVVDESIKYSNELGLKIPHTMITIKPSGSVSKLFSLTEGWHLPSMRQYLRWVQFRHDDPLISIYEKLGYPIRELVQYQGTTIVGFPTAPTITKLGMGDKLVTAAEASPEEQYKWLMLGEKYWIHGTDDFGNLSSDFYGNQISYTLKYDPTEIDFPHFKKMLLKYQPLIKCCAVMPQIENISYEYQPEQPINKEEYESLVKVIEKRKNKRHENISEDVGKEHVDCSTGGCPIDFRTGDKGD